MQVTETTLPGVLIIKPKVFGDERGFFMETYQSMRYGQAGVATSFVQDNLSYSQRGVLRGLHFQQPNPQGKLISVLQGEVFDVAVDIRTGSPTFGQWTGVLLSAQDRRQLWIPEGFAHGFCVTGEAALLSYRCTRLYDPASEHAIRWDDPNIGVDWPVASPVLSDKDIQAPMLADIAPSLLPQYREAGA